MKRLGIQKKRAWSGFMAVVLLVSVILSAFTPTRTWAATFAGKNIWTGNAEVMFGRSRNYLYRWTDGYQMTFCIDPGDHMSSEVRAGAKRYNINDENIPYITSREDFERLALICDWFDTQAGSISASNASYAAAQAAVWAIVTCDWDNVDDIVSQVNRHVSGTSIRWQELKKYIDNSDTGLENRKLPEWCSITESSAPIKKMTLLNGKYRIDLDLTECPELASVIWEFPDNKWSKSVSGNTLTITYNGANAPRLLLKGNAPSSMNSIVKNSQNLTIYIPERERDQAMIGAGVKQSSNMLYMLLTGGYAASNESESNLEIFEHNETFESHYNIDLTKFDAETGQTLEGSIFEILEAFDDSQLELVESGSMSPSPSTWSGFRSDGQMMTDEEGYSAHRDVRYYDYSKTYCGGHPEPEYLDIPVPEPDPATGDILNAGEIEAAEGENQRLRAEWEAIVASCEAQTDFHSVTAGAGLEMMLEDRDSTYEEFIHLEYDYTVRETEARYGYILHGKHNDDEAIPVIRIHSSEAGASSTIIPRNVRVVRGETSYSTFRKAEQDEIYMETLLPEPVIYSLDESRMISITEELIEVAQSEEGEILEEKEENHEMDPAATSSEAEKIQAGSLEESEENILAERTEREKVLLQKIFQKEITKAAAESAAEEPTEKPAEDDAENAAKEPIEKPAEDTTENAAKEPTEKPAEDTTENTAEEITGKPTEEPTEEPSEEEKEGAAGETGKSTEMDMLEGADDLEMRTEYNYTMLERSYGEIPHPRINNLPESMAVYHSLSLDTRMAAMASYRGGAGLPSPQEDNVDWITPSGDTDTVACHFRISNHRTEGEIHINKRDLELYDQDPDGSYGQTQGDATLEGAVYGLYAAQDILHPDGKTGVVYQQNDLVALAATDKNGDASFMAYTEESSQSGNTQNLEGRWVGHPLILGHYYIKEISRSEGYELSVYGISLEDSNRLGAERTLTARGSASSSTLGHPIDMHDGSWNEFTVTAKDTVDGYDIQITGYPEGSEIYQSDLVETTVMEKVVVGSVRKETGEYEKAEAGEKKLDEEGNYIPILDEEGEPRWDETGPLAETFFTYYRLNAYPSGTAVPGNPGKWSSTSSPDLDYVRQETNAMLKQTGFKTLDADDGDGAPWSIIDLQGATNRELAESILDWFAENNFWDAGSVHRVYEEEGGYKAEIFHDYRAVIAPAIYDALNGVVYLRKDITVDGGAVNSHIFLPYPEGEFSISGFYTTVSPAKNVTGTVPFMADLKDYVEIQYQPLYETYAEGDYRLDRNGNKIPVYETEFIFGEEEQTAVDYRLTPVEAVYDREKGSYHIHVENTADWKETDVLETTYRMATKEKTITIDGEEMYYNDYLIHVQGAGASACPAVNEEETSYIKYLNLAYPGQQQVYQDGHTRAVPVQVLERVIKQSIKVTKDVSQESYDQNNTYRMHKDPFTVLFGGYHGTGRKYISGFRFKAYLVSDLEAAVKLPVKADGTYDFDAFFSDKVNETAWKELAVRWDRPEKDADGDLTTIHANEGGGAEAYYGTSVMLPYGIYVVVEQVPEELLNKHYQIDQPRVVILPFVPEITAGGTVSSQPSSDYLYFADDTPEELVAKFGIRFHEETDVIQAHNHEGDFEIYKYGLDKEVKPERYGNAAIGERYRWESTSEDAGTIDGIYYEVLYDRDGQAVDYGVTLDEVKTMTGMTTAINGTYAQALVPWSVLDERSGEDGNRYPGLEADGTFNFVSFLKTHFENTLYSSKLRVEKVDAGTGENIIHAGALFRIYAASRDVAGDGPDHVTGTGSVTFQTRVVTGTREELEARGDVDDIFWNGTTFEGTVTEPDYSRLELVSMLDETGTEVGIFKAFSTEREMVKSDGSVIREPAGYIQTYQPLGAGTYVLVEIQAPPGYMRSKPVAFEVYRDQVSYYPDGDPNDRTEAERYQYVVPRADPDGELVYEDVSRVYVRDKPSSLYIHKVEDGDRIAGDENILDGLTGVNDKGDMVTYLIRGRKEYLEARGDVRNITWDTKRRVYCGTVSKRYQEWSEDLIAGTEAQLRAMENVKLLYDVESGDFSGFGIRFGIAVKEAGLALYKGLKVERTGDHTYRGVTVRWNDGKVEEITASETGSYLEITTRERETTPPYHNIWDAQRMDHEPVSVYFYDLDKEETEEDEQTGELWVLDERGNRLCLADPVSGMAYVYDEYGHMIVYETGEAGEKVTAESIEVHGDDAGQHIYIDIHAEEDEAGLPLFYTDGRLTYREETWITDGTPHEIARLPFGAYILEENHVPYDQGYIQSPHMGLILRESGENQHFYMQDDFTKVNIAKIDVTTKKEIRDAAMTLYEAAYIRDGSSKGYHLEKGGVYTEWISGYQYDDDGSIMLQDGEKIVTTRPYWMDHIPPGWYILEETRVPGEWGYIQSEPVEIHVLETGDVQTFIMEDDYTAIEIRKYDKKTGEVLDDGHQAVLSLYRPVRDAEGNPVYKSSRDIPGQEIPVYDPDARIVTWETGSGEEVASSGRLVTDEYGDTAMVYDYDVRYVDVTPDIRQARYYLTETGTTRFEYLPVGDYVLVEETAPIGYATAMPQLITVRETGHQEVQEYEMADSPLVLEISKTDKAAGYRQVRDAHLAVYPVADGIRGTVPLYQWVSGTDGIYMEEEAERGEIPAGFQVGDLKPHSLEYIPVGDYVLAEESTPFGFLKAQDLYFTVVDTAGRQGIEMVDELPKGILTITKHDADEMDRLLPGAVFTLTDQGGRELVQTLVTGDDGTAVSNPVPTGYLNEEGTYIPYTYVVQEVTAPEDYMLNTGAYEFQFAYTDPEKPIITWTYDAVNRQNQVRFKKQDDGGDFLAGAKLKVVRKDTGVLVEEWISGNQDHYITGIRAGEYTLIEAETPGTGYALAADMDFTVGKNMTEPVYVEMTDPSSRVDVGKVAAGTTTLLAGAKLQLLSGDGNLVREWTSGNQKPETFYGLEPGKYTIKELSAPSGYKKGEDLSITVEDTDEVQVFYFENDKQPGGGGVTPVPKYVSFRKAGTDGRFLAGAEFTFYQAEGRIYAVETTDHSGTIRIPMPPAGTYTFKETKAPEGYYINSQTYSFTVTGDKVVSGDYKIQDVPHTTVELMKKSAETGEVLAGAVFQILQKGEVLLEGTTDAGGKLRFQAPEPGTYQIKEIKAPEHYRASDILFEFTVSEEGKVTGNTTIYNSEYQKIGRVIAHYETSLTGGGSAAFGIPGKIVPGAKTGDDTPIMLFVTIWILSMAGMGICLSKKGIYAFIIITGTMWLFMAGEMPVYAAQEAGLENISGHGFLTVRTEPFTDDPQNHIPEEIYEYQGKTYRLEDYEVVETELPPRIEEVSETVVYDTVEQADVLPSTAVIEVLDEVSREKKSVTVPLKEYAYRDYRWVEDFEFAILVEEADADRYALGDLLVERQEENPFAGYETELLDLIGVSPQAYRISRVEWISEPWQGEDGIVYRQAMARGSKQVATAAATYSGIIELESVPAFLVEAVYREEIVETVVEIEAETGHVLIQEQTGSDERGSFLERFLSRTVIRVISVSLLLILIVVLLLWYILYGRKRRRDHGKK